MWVSLIFTRLVDINRYPLRKRFTCMEVIESKKIQFTKKKKEKNIGIF